ncbi:hypothetical protein SBOR_0456 [Sclerotinia borealis F-4128]|uniref:J domain-containing protein n=1 Tax=Sclerotinia borealis (strain F-4128) TaxID=1432307 RepID=W9CQQ9_SCLBF|nr:hypothetical protein SBOR_0456 [Sclerotinia borealis F-4128]
MFRKSHDKKCDTPDFTPHYYNLDLPIDATQKDIKEAYRRLVRIIHPDKFRDPDQKGSAFTAIQLITEAYEVLSDEEKREEYRLLINNYQKYRFETKWELDYWDEKWRKKHHRDKGIRPKPWFWHYDPLAAGGMCISDEEDDVGTHKRFCTATWVNLAHLLVDNGLSNTISDNIWRRAETWRDGALNETQTQPIYMDFQRGCENFQLKIMKKEAFIPWSQIPSNTDWGPTLGYACELFCPDILIVPIMIILIIFYLFLFICVRIFRYLTRSPTPAFWPESAISTPTLADPLMDDIMTRSRRASHASAPRRQGSSSPSEQDYYADEEIYPGDTSSQPQFHTAVTSRRRSPTIPSDKSSPTQQFHSAVETPGRSSTNPSNKSSTQFYSAVATQGRSATNPSERSPTTQSNRAGAEPQQEPMNPSQLLSLTSSERHYYYSDKNDLPLRERRDPSVIPEPLCPRFVHYEDEDYADDEFSPRLCVALTATGKPCQRRVSIVTPLSGSTVDGLVSPLCFQHRNIRKWVRSNKEDLNEQDTSRTPGRLLSLTKSPVVGKTRSSGRLAH